MFWEQLRTEYLGHWALKLLAVVVIFFLTALLVKFIRWAIKSLMQTRLPNVNEGKKNTILTALLSVIKFVMYFLAISLSLWLFGINTAAILTAAGIGGIALAFGAQTIIQDLFKGVFLLAEDQFNVGDFVKLGGVTGTVEALGLRTTKIRDYSGALHIIPNSEINLVTNYSHAPQKADVTLSVNYTIPIGELEKVIQRATEKMDKEGFVDMPSFVGVTETERFYYKVLITASTKPGLQWEGSRRLRRALLEELQQTDLRM